MLLEVKFKEGIGKSTSSEVQVWQERLFPVWFSV